MRKEPTTRLLHLARQFAAEPAGISLDEIVTRFSVSRHKALEGASHHAVIPNINTIDKLREVWPRLSSDEDASRGRASQNGLKIPFRPKHLLRPKAHRGFWVVVLDWRGGKVMYAGPREHSRPRGS
jgi:hypothetical protein